MPNNFDDSDIIFADEITPPDDTNDNTPWKIIIADDDNEVHTITRLVLEDYILYERKVEFIHAYSGTDTINIVKANPDAAILLLDVVMESDNAGLEVVRYIREVAKNSFIRIILRTGQPGMAPEKEIITEYDINDYKEKTELTATKLYTIITASLRAYNDLRNIDKNRRGLKKVIESSVYLSDNRSIEGFTHSILQQLILLLNMDNIATGFDKSGFCAISEKERMVIKAGIGKYESCIGKTVCEAVPEDINKYLFEGLEKNKSLFIDSYYISYFYTKSGVKIFLFVNNITRLSEIDMDLVNVFTGNAYLAFENMYLNKDIIDTQKEIIIKIGEVVETRSQSTANHVKRVADYSYLLAKLAGLDENKIELLKQASPIHDVGKVGVPDNILLKPGKLTPEEFEKIKEHTSLGYNILKTTERDIIKAAAIIAHQHHERWDGKGYPQGLSGEEIHIFGRIVSITDVFDALAHKRSYKDAWAIENVIDYIREQRGKQFDPRLVDIFLDNIDQFLEINIQYPDDSGQ